MSSHAVATRLSTENLAKLYESLISRGIPESELTTISQIIRIALYTVIIDNTKDINIPPLETSINFIKQITSKK